VAQYFSQGLDGNHMEVGGMSFSVTEKTIVEVTTLPADEDNIFHSHVFAGIDVPFFFQEEFQGKNWRFEVLKEWL